MDFKEYKQKATEDDIKKVANHYFPKWWENIPLFGALFCYGLRMLYWVQGIDRGPLRQEITKFYIFATVAGLFWLTFIIHILTPWLNFFIMKQAIKKTESRISKNQL